MQRLCPRQRSSLLIKTSSSGAGHSGHAAPRAVCPRILGGDIGLGSTGCQSQPRSLPALLPFASAGFPQACTEGNGMVEGVSCSRGASGSRVKDTDLFASASSRWCPNAARGQPGPAALSPGTQGCGRESSSSPSVLLDNSQLSSSPNRTPHPRHLCSAPLPASYFQAVPSWISGLPASHDGCFWGARPCSGGRLLHRSLCPVH